MRQDAFGVRLPKDMLVRIEKLSRDEHEDRSTVIRKLVMVGYAGVMKEKAADKYVGGKVTLSEAAHQAGLTVWEMEQYLVGRGFTSSYSIEDLERETRLLG